MLEDLIRGDITEKNFTTYNYIYNVINVITTEKNKTLATKKIVGRLTEYALIYGFTKYYINKFANSSSISITLPSGATENITPSAILKNLLNTEYGRKSSNFVDLMSIDALNTNSFSSDKTNLVEDKEANNLRFNLLMDIVYDVLINDNTIKSRYLLSDKITNSEFLTWYRNDNLYIRYTETKKAKNPDDIKRLIALRSDMASKFSAFIAAVDTTIDLGQLIENLAGKESGIEDLTKAQYEAMRAILRDAIAKLQNTTKNNSFVSKVTDFLLDYTLVEYKNENVDASGTKSILFVDIESLILVLDDKYQNPNKKSSNVQNWWGFPSKYVIPWYWVKPKPFLKIGANYGQFRKGNILVKDENGTQATELDNLYFASEKLGLRFTFLDPGYTHAFKEGETFKYHGYYTKWRRPQTIPTISRLHLEFYMSGLLYNLANLKTEKGFNYTIVGSNLGITFFNGLSFSAGVGYPINAKGDFKQNRFFTAGFDIPIIEYLAALKNKK